METIVEVLRPRGEIVSLMLVALVLWRAVPGLARALAAPERVAGDLAWHAGLAFVVVGRAVYLLAEAPGSLLDPLVVVRVQGGIEPLAGAGAAAAVVLWTVRDRLEDAWPLVSVASLALLLAVAAYDLACLARDACYGTPAAAPLGFPMGGLAESRVATPLLEGATLLAVAALLLRWWTRLRPGVGALLAVASVALLRAAMTPLGVAGWRGVSGELALLAAIGVGCTAAAVALQRVERARLEGAPADEAPRRVD